jgi:hypothetical protein
MRDFFRFVCRSALGSAIAGATLTALIILCFFGSSWELLYLFHPIALVCFAIPGAIIGFVLWIVSALTGAKLSAISRIAIGIGVVPAIYFILVLYELGGHLDRLDFSQLSFSTPVVWLLLWVGVIGGLAGLASPSEKLFKEETGLTYWERVALYEIAQVEAGLASKRHPHPIGEI